MLALPDVGMRTSVTVHNVDLAILCDWVEASVVFDSEEMSRSEVIDTLLENHVYQNQDFAAEIVESAWAILRERFEYLGGPLGITATGNRISRKQSWDTFPAYGFCLALSCAEVYPAWAGGWSTPPATHGDMFERLVAESVEKRFTGWTVRRLGWSPTNAVRLRATIDGMIGDLSEKAGAEIDTHVTNSANELGLDLLVYHSFADGESSFPVFMIQCASGKNWVEKRHTPDMNIWSKVVSFNSHPVKGFAMPFAFSDGLELRKAATPVNGLFMERNRLLGVFKANPANLSSDLNNSLIEWTSAQVKSIPRAEA
jgi:hypothetical protein